MSLSNNGIAESFIFVPEAATVIDKHTVCLDEADGYLLYSILPDKWQMNISDHLINIREQKNKKGNYNRKKISQKGLVANEVDITNIYMRAPEGCKTSVSNIIQKNGNELIIFEQNYTVNINFSTKNIVRTKKLITGTGNKQL